MGWLDRVRSMVGGGGGLGVPKLGAIAVPREAAQRAAPRLLALHEALTALAELPGLDRFASERRLPRAFPAHLDAIWAAYDTFAQGLIDDIPLAVTCAPRCAHCCHDAPTPVRGFELLALYRAIRPRKDFRALHDRCADRGEWFQAELARQSGGRTSVRSDSAPFLRARAAFASARQPCPLLHPTRHTCLVYDARPLPCRMHVSVDEPALCDPAHPGDVTPTTPNLAPPEPLVDTMRTVDARLGLDDLSAVLPVGLAELGARVMRGEALRWTED